MNRPLFAKAVLVTIAVLVVVTLMLLTTGPVQAHDMPDEVVIQTYVKPAGRELDVLLRVPLVLLLNMDLPKRGPGFLDLAQIDPALERSGMALAEEIAFFENGRRLAPSRMEGRISIPSDKSFESYEAALAHLQGERLPDSTDVFWNQGFFDIRLQYPIRSQESDFALQLFMAPELEKRAHLIIRFLPSKGTVRTYDVAGSGDRILLDPRWHQAALTFTKAGFFHVLDGIDHLLFLLCLVIPFRHGRLRPLVAIVTSFTIAHSITLIAAAYELAPSGPWFLPLVETLIAASIVYMALENIVASSAPGSGTVFSRSDGEAGPDARRQPALQRRWLITGGFGLVHGVGFSFGLKQSFQLAGDHLLLSLVSFNVGVEVAQMVVLVAAVVALRFLSRQVAREGVLAIILSALLAHTGWHWTLERGQQLRVVEWPALDITLLVALGRVALVLLLAGGAVSLLIRLIPRAAAVRRLRAVEEEGR